MKAELRYLSSAIIFEHTANSYNMRIYGTNGQMDLRCSSYDVHDCFVRLYDGEGLTEAEIELLRILTLYIPTYGLV